jgi:uncharacterized membrane protein YccC
MNGNAAGASPVERTVRPLLDRLRAGCTDLDGTEMVDESQPTDCLTVCDVRDAVTEIQRLRAELQHARDGLTKGRSRMREDLERHKPLVQAVEWLLDDGHMNTEHLARLRAAWEAALGPNVRANLPP